MSGPSEQGERPSFNATQEDNALLWALQQYQKVIRHWMRELTAIEFTVLMQILDRTVGWQRMNRTIGIPNILSGGRHYAGIGHAVKKASLMKALRSLEDKGIIERRRSPVHSQMKDYLINLDWTPPHRPALTDIEEQWEPDDEGYVPSLWEQSLNQST
ncbi:hypothetical protein ACFQ1E_13015 [Sphingomonas canadensis]|uniref:Bacteriophage lambda Replication protein O N-terminal domain-containing protein n=1 Tax=Sphingomonas canadensis TaxID=1219257 RepID=A0ABW3H719_9SPHN|nr:hypothetical protein [Sphingomonas canadensis]MCW3837082.1 hypothetical protein [Sphingomonas canadensis]